MSAKSYVNNNQDLADALKRMQDDPNSTEAKYWKDRTGGKLTADAFGKAHADETNALITGDYQDKHGAGSTEITPGTKTDFAKEHIPKLKEANVESPKVKERENNEKAGKVSDGAGVATPTTTEVDDKTGTTTLTAPGSKTGQSNQSLARLENIQNLGLLGDGFVWGTNISVDRYDDPATPQHEGFDLSTALWNAAKNDQVDTWNSLLDQARQTLGNKAGLLDVTVEPRAEASGGYSWFDDLAGADNRGTEVVTGEPVQKFFGPQHEEYTTHRETSDNLFWEGGDPTKGFWEPTGGWKGDGTLGSTGTGTGTGAGTGLPTYGSGSRGLGGSGEYLSTPYTRPALQDWSHLAPPEGPGLLGTAPAQRALLANNLANYQTQAQGGVIDYAPRGGSAWAPRTYSTTSPPRLPATTTTTTTGNGNGTWVGPGGETDFAAWSQLEHDRMYPGRQDMANIMGGGGLDFFGQGGADFRSQVPSNSADWIRRYGTQGPVFGVDYDATGLLPRATTQPVVPLVTNIPGETVGLTPTINSLLSGRVQ